MTHTPEAQPSRVVASRPARVLRGALGAFIVALLAAASHSLAGGNVTLSSIIIAGIITTPLCVALAGRMASPWRLALAVGLSQLGYHWFFASVDVTGVLPHSHTAGAALSANELADALPAYSAHALHLATPGMILLHTVAALFTMLVLLYGDIAMLTLRQLIAGIARTIWALPAQLQTSRPTVAPARTPWRATLASKSHLRNRIHRRGPPLVAA